MAENKAENLVVKRYYPELDGLRAIAVLLVLWWHSSQWAYNITPALGAFSNMYASISIIGALGVSLFFALSGFLISGILMDLSERKDYLKVFYIRRFFRIFPLYYLSIIVISILSILYIQNFNLGDRIWYYVFYLQNIDRLFYGELPFEDERWLFFNHFWSLAIEEHFYIIWPLLFVWMYRNLSFSVCVCSMLCIAIISACIRYIMAVGGMWEHAQLFTFSRVDALILGSVLAYIMNSNMSDSIMPVLKKLSCKIAPLSPVILSISVLYFSQYESIFVIYAKYMILLGGVFSFFLLVYVINVSYDKSLFQKVLCSGAFKYLSQISYGFYIFHIPILSVIQYYLLEHTSLGYWDNHIILFLLGGVITLSVASLSYYYFEKPILRLKDKYAPLN